VTATHIIAEAAFCFAGFLAVVAIAWHKEWKL
jgi:hypothetical protein